MYLHLTADKCKKHLQYKIPFPLKNYSDFWNTIIIITLFSLFFFVCLIHLQTINYNKLSQL